MRFIKKMKSRIEKNRKVVNGIFMAGIVSVVSFSYPVPVLAAADVTTRMGMIETLVSSIITAGGSIWLLWGVFDFASAYQGHDSSQQTAGLKKIVAGILAVLAPSIVAMLK